MWAGHLARRKGLEENPLRRTSDRVEAWLTLVLIAAMVLVASWAAWTAARATYRDDVRLVAYERMHRFRVEAVLLEDAPWPAAAAGGQTAPRSVPTMARWPSPDGAIHTGTVFADAGPRAGSAVVPWVDDRGVITGPPPYRNPRMDAALAGLLAACAVVTGLAGIRWTVRRLLDRRRLRSWQTEWSAVEPRWSREV